MQAVPSLQDRRLEAPRYQEASMGTVPTMQSRARARSRGGCPS